MIEEWKFGACPLTRTHHMDCTTIMYRSRDTRAFTNFRRRGLKIPLNANKVEPVRSINFANRVRERERERQREREINRERERGGGGGIEKEKYEMHGRRQLQVHYLRVMDIARNSLRCETFPKPLDRQIQKHPDGHLLSLSLSLSLSCLHEFPPSPIP